MANKMNMCRACLITEESFSYVLFENVSADIYLFCTSIEVTEDEQLPKAICNSCYEQLEKFFEFKNTCIRSQNTLISFTGDVKSENDEISNNITDLNPIDAIKKDTIKLEDRSDDNDSQTDNVLDYLDDIKKCKIKIKKRKCKEKSVNHKVKLKNQKQFLYTCSVCSKRFKYEDRYEAHKLLHEGKTVTIYCKLCNKTFMTWSGLQKHNESEHTLIKLDLLKCMDCGKILKNKESLRLHQKRHINANKSQFVCDICGKNFSTRFVLKGHLQIHNEARDRAHSCEHCGKKYFNNSILLTHIARAHSGRRYVCQICDYPFTDKYNLSKHLLIHQGVKNHKCDICDKAFGTQSTLVIHKRTHSGERPFSCSYCLKGFISKTRLVDHQRIHTGERPFRCTICNQTYTQRGSLKRHMKIHNKGH